MKSILATHTRPRFGTWRQWCTFAEFATKLGLAVIWPERYLAHHSGFSAQLEPWRCMISGQLTTHSRLSKARDSDDIFQDQNFESFALESSDLKIRSETMNEGVSRLRKVVSR